MACQGQIKKPETNGRSIGGNDLDSNKNNADPDRLRKVDELARLLGLEGSSKDNLAKALAADPNAFASIYAAVSGIATSNQELLSALGDELGTMLRKAALAGDTRTLKDLGKALVSKVKFRLGLNDSQGKPIETVFFVDTAGVAATEQIIGKGLKTSLRLVASYSQSAETRDVTLLANYGIIGTSFTPDSVSPYIVSSDKVNSSASVIGDLGGKQANIKLTVKDASVSYSMVIRNEHSDAVGPKIPLGVIASARVIAELKDFRGNRLALSDVTDSAEFAPVTGIVWRVSTSKFSRKGLFSGTLKGMHELVASGQNGGATFSATAAVEILDPIQLGIVFTGRFSSFYSISETIACSEDRDKVESDDASNFVFIGEELIDFEPQILNSDCSTSVIPQTTILSFKAETVNDFPPTSAAIVTPAMNLFFKSESGKYVAKAAAIFATAASSGALPSLNYYLGRVLARKVAFVISDGIVSAPELTCPSGAHGAQSQLMDFGINPIENVIPVHVWLVEGDCVVTKLDLATTDLISLSLPDEVTIPKAKLGAGGSFDQNFIYLQSSRGLNDVTVRVLGTYTEALKRRCGLEDTICTGTVVETDGLTLKTIETNFTAAGVTPVGLSLDITSEAICSTGGASISLTEAIVITPAFSIRSVDTAISDPQACVNIPITSTGVALSYELAPLDQNVAIFDPITNTISADPLRPGGGTVDLTISTTTTMGSGTKNLQRVFTFKVQPPP